MHLLITIVHVTVCIALILVVLLQTGKGADMGAAFGGGGSQTLFGSAGPTNILSKGTTIVAIVFMLTSLGLALPGKSVVDQVKAPTPVSQEAPADAVAPADLPSEEAAAPAAATEAPAEAAAQEATEQTTE